MIDKIPVDDCCGCEACRQICPVKCIDMIEDEEGFFYPKVIRECVKCGMCLNVCPVYLAEKGDSV